MNIRQDTPRRESNTGLKAHPALRTGIAAAIAALALTACGDREPQVDVADASQPTAATSPNTGITGTNAPAATTGNDAAGVTGAPATSSVGGGAPGTTGSASDNPTTAPNASGSPGSVGIAPQGAADTMAGAGVAGTAGGTGAQTGAGTAAPGTGAATGTTVENSVPPRAAQDRVAGDTSAAVGGTDQITNAPPTAAGNPTLTPAEKTFVTQASTSGIFEVEAARIAANKATDGTIRNYATMLINHHSAANDELMQLAGNRNVPLPQGVSADRKGEIEKLRAMPEKEFDRHFVQTIGVQAHQRDIKLFESASSSVRDPELRAWIEKTLPTLREHLAQAKALPVGGGG